MHVVVLMAGHVLTMLPVAWVDATPGAAMRCCSHGCQVVLAIPGTQGGDAGLTAAASCVCVCHMMCSCGLTVLTFCSIWPILFVICCTRSRKDVSSCRCSSAAAGGLLACR